MRNVKKPVFFVVVIVIALFTLLNIIGVKTINGDFETTIVKSIEDIRWGIDIRGGVNVTFAPEEGVDASQLELDAVKSKMEERLVSMNITDNEVYVDYSNDRVIVSFPWKSDEKNFDPQEAVQELGETAFLTFREGNEIDTETGYPTGVTKDTVILVGEDVKLAVPHYDTNENQYVVSLELSKTGADKFSEATKKLAEDNGIISIWMDNYCISAPTVNEHIPNGQAVISSGSFNDGVNDIEDVTDLANKINSGALPFSLRTVSLSSESPSGGESAKDSMLISGVIAFILIAIFMAVMYKLPGWVSIISLFGQVVGTIACLTGFFGVFESFTLTIPGIAGIILAVGMGVDANIITAERIKEELKKGKSLDGSIHLGFSKAFTAIFDGNITVVLIALILMGSFGPPDSIMAKILSPIFFMFGPTTAGAIYSFGFTLLVGVIMNFVFGVLASRLMITSLSKFKAFRKTSLYGMPKAQKEEKVYNVYKSKKIFLIISSTVILITLIFSIYPQPKVAIEFAGGTMISYSYVGEKDVDAVDDVVTAFVGTDVSVKTGENISNGATYYEISFNLEDGFPADRQAELSDLMIEKFPDANIEYFDSSDVNSTLGNEFFKKCLVAVTFSFIILVIYIGLRFKRIGGWSAGVMALVALLHDIIVVYGVFVVFGIQINANFMAVVLTILGYSINDTLVIYDRIRENKKLLKNLPSDRLTDVSISQTLSRSLNTTISTITALIVVTIVALITGVDSIISFSFPLIIGLISGVYSSICIATPLWVMWQQHRAKVETNAYAKKNK